MFFLPNVFIFVFMLISFLFTVTFLTIILRSVRQFKEESQQKQVENEKATPEKVHPKKVDPIVHSSESTAIATPPTQKRNENKQNRNKKNSKKRKSKKLFPPKPETVQNSQKEAAIEQFEDTLTQLTSPVERQVVTNKTTSSIKNQLSEPRNLAQVLIVKELLDKPVSLRK